MWGFWCRRGRGLERLLEMIYGEDGGGFVAVRAMVGKVLRSGGYMQEDTPGIHA